MNLSTVGYAKTEVSITALTELGLISKDVSGKYRITGVQGKTELKNSPTYKKLLERSETV